MHGLEDPRVQNLQGLGLHEIQRQYYTAQEAPQEAPQEGMPQEEAALQLFLPIQDMPQETQEGTPRSIANVVLGRVFLIVLGAYAETSRVQLQAAQARSKAHAEVEEPPPPTPPPGQPPAFALQPPKPGTPMAWLLGQSSPQPKLASAAAWLAPASSSVPGYVEPLLSGPALLSARGVLPARWSHEEWIVMEAAVLGLCEDVPEEAAITAVPEEGAEITAEEGAVPEEGAEEAGWHAETTAESTAEETTDERTAENCLHRWSRLCFHRWRRLHPHAAMDKVPP